MPSMPSVPLTSASPSLAASVDRRSPARRSASPPGVRAPSLAEHPSLAEQHQRAVRQRRQVTGRAERAVLRHPRRDVVVEQVHQGLRDQRADPGTAQRQRPDPQQHHRPDHLAGHRRADPGGVRADQRVLQLGPPLRRDERVGQRAEAGGHPVHRAAVALDARPRSPGWPPSPPMAGPRTTRASCRGPPRARRPGGSRPG